MFVWYWLHMGEAHIEIENYPWTDFDSNYPGSIIVKPSESCMMVPPDTWDCE